MLSLLFLASAVAAIPAGNNFAIVGDAPKEIFWVGEKLYGHYGEETDYGWNNNCRVLKWGARWHTPDGSKKSNALVECIHKERSIAYDVRKIGPELDCVAGSKDERSCTRQHSESSSVEVEVSAGIEGEGFSLGSKFKSTETTSDSQTFTYKVSCEDQGRQCEIGGKAMIEYDMYIGWVHWDSWRYPDSGSGPQWINAGDDGAGMWDYRYYQKHSYDGNRESGWYRWRASDDDCNVYGQNADYASDCK